MVIQHIVTVCVFLAVHEIYPVYMWSIYVETVYMWRLYICGDTTENLLLAHLLSKKLM